MDWVVGAIFAIFLTGFFWGLYRGALRIAVSLFATVVTLAIVTFVTPYVTEMAIKLTPLDDIIQSKVESAITESVEAKVEEAEEGILGDYKDQIPQDYQDQITESVLKAEIPRDLQMAAIENADLPEIFKTLLAENNNDEIYEELGVESFAQYAGAFLANLIIHSLSFLATFFVVTVILRAIIFGLDIVTNLPVLGFLNHMAGGAVGLAVSLLVVWVVFLIVTLAYTTEVGRSIYDSVQANSILRMIYENNPIMGLAVR